MVASAAMIMFSVFVSFVSTPDSTLKTVAFGLAFGVAVDALIVRMTFVPAVPALIGRRSWWVPARLSRIIPNPDIEGGTSPEPYGPASTVLVRRRPSQGASASQCPCRPLGDHVVVRIGTDISPNFWNFSIDAHTSNTWMAPSTSIAQ
jgi:hypothetical protein